MADQSAGLKSESSTGQKLGSMELHSAATRKGASATPQSQFSVTDEYRPPFQKHIDPTGKLLFVTVQVRVLNGDVERDCVLRFKDPFVTAQQLCDAIAYKEGIVDKELIGAFRLWIVGKDLELQNRPYDRVNDIVSKWNSRCDLMNEPSE
jgi:hypothetical protein